MNAMRSPCNTVTASPTPTLRTDMPTCPNRNDVAPQKSNARFEIQNALENKFNRKRIYANSPIETSTRPVRQMCFIERSMDGYQFPCGFELLICHIRFNKLTKFNPLDVDCIWHWTLSTAVVRADGWGGWRWPLSVRVLLMLVFVAQSEMCNRRMVRDVETILQHLRVVGGWVDWIWAGGEMRNVTQTASSSIRVWGWVIGRLIASSFFQSQIIHSLSAETSKPPNEIRSNQRIRRKEREREWKRKKKSPQECNRPSLGRKENHQSELTTKSKCDWRVQSRLFAFDVWLPREIVWEAFNCNLSIWPRISQTTEPTEKKKPLDAKQRQSNRMQ